MSRPRIYEEERCATAVRLPVSLARQLRKVAHQRDVSVNLLNQRAVEDLLRRLTDIDQVPGAAVEAPGCDQP